MGALPLELVAAERLTGPKTRSAAVLPPMVDIHGDGPAKGNADHDIGLMLVELRLSGADNRLKVIVIENGGDDGVAVVLQVGRLNAARNRMPAV